MEETLKEAELARQKVDEQESAKRKKHEDHEGDENDDDAASTVTGR
jgi:hypothetical protein